MNSTRKTQHTAPRDTYAYSSARASTMQQLICRPQGGASVDRLRGYHLFHRRPPPRRRHTRRGQPRLAAARPALRPRRPRHVCLGPAASCACVRRPRSSPHALPPRNPSPNMRSICHPSAAHPSQMSRSHASQLQRHAHRRSARPQPPSHCKPAPPSQHRVMSCPSKHRLGGGACHTTVASDL